MDRSPTPHTQILNSISWAAFFLSGLDCADVLVISENVLVVGVYRRKHQESPSVISSFLLCHFVICHFVFYRRTHACTPVMLVFFYPMGSISDTTEKQQKWLYILMFAFR